MVGKFRELDKQQPMELTTDFLGEDRHELVTKLAHQHWEKRGRPFGSPEIDWLAAERAVYSSLVASGLVAPSANDSQTLARKIYSELPAKPRKKDLFVDIDRVIRWVVDIVPEEYDAHGVYRIVPPNDKSFRLCQAKQNNN